MAEPTRQIVVIGDGFVGKTCLLHSYSNENFLGEYVATIYDKEVFGVTVDGVEYLIKLIDTAGQEDYEQIRRIFYREADCFIICYDISNQASYTNVYEKWIPELKSIERWPIPVVLVATKIDLRQISHRTLITTEKGEQLSQLIKAYRFVESSAKENIHVEEAIHEAVRAAVKKPVAVEGKSDRGEKWRICSCCQS